VNHADQPIAFEHRHRARIGAKHELRRLPIG
jgi:hypothetical protein